MPRKAAGNIAAALAGLEGADRPDLLVHWHRSNDRPPPKNISGTLLKRAVAYRLQELAYGGLRPATRRYLRQIADNDQRATAVAPPVIADKMAPGSRLIREWNGGTYEVTITPDGRFEMNGTNYRSLTEIAKAITGTNWSGPRFFGLVKVKSK